MTAVRIRACDQAGKVIDLSDVRPPTDVMAITSLPYAPSQSSGLRFSFEWFSAYPPTAIRPPYLLLGAATSVTKTAVLGE
jgi:hypothetical protein